MAKNFLPGHWSKWALKYFSVIPPTWSAVNAASLMFTLIICNICRIFAMPKFRHISDTYFGKIGQFKDDTSWDLPWHMWWPPNNVIFLSFYCAKGPPFLLVTYQIQDPPMDHYVVTKLDNCMKMVEWRTNGRQTLPNKVLPNLFIFIMCIQLPKRSEPMMGENRQLVTDEGVEFQK